jgi:hypothetical protein
MMGSIGQIVSVILLSGVKLAMGGVPLALVYGFSFWQTVIWVSTGGTIGVLAFIYLSKYLWQFLNPLLGKIFETKTAFTPNNRRIIRVKKRYGLIGIALLTPSLISIPVGCFIAAKFFKNKAQITLYMIVSVVLWTMLLGSIKFLF